MPHGAVILRPKGAISGLARCGVQEHVHSTQDFRFFQLKLFPSNLVEAGIDSASNVVHQASVYSVQVTTVPGNFPMLGVHGRRDWNETASERPVGHRKSIHDLVGRPQTDAVHWSSLPTREYSDREVGVESSMVLS